MTDNFDMDLAIEQGCDKAQKFIDQLRKNKQKDMSDVRLLDAFLRQIPIPPLPDRPKGAMPLKGLGLGVVQQPVRTPTNPSPDGVPPEVFLPPVAKNGSAQKAITELPRPSDLSPTNSGNLRERATPSDQSPAMTTGTNKVQLDRWDIALAKAPTTGASNTTARNQIGMSGGMPASIRMAEMDWIRIEPIRERFYLAATKYDVPPSLLAAIASRESHVGSALDRNGLGDNGNAFGIMQVDKRFHLQAGVSRDTANQIHINQGAEILDAKRTEVIQMHRDWGDEYILKGATAAYNSGSANIQTKIGIDRGTAGDDYGSDVIARAQYYSQRMKSLAECKAEQISSTSLHTEGSLKQIPKGKAATESSEPIGKVEEVKEIPKNLTAKDVDWSDMSFHLTPHFTLGENLLYDDQRIPYDTTIQNNILIIMRELEKIRIDYGNPIIITSGYRPEPINSAVGGKSYSQHIPGLAVDICPADRDVDIFEFQKWVDENWYGALGWGAERGFVHIDCRNGKGWKTGGEKGVRWPY
jgi:uncharacterized protein YcbK (DUF882 family)